MHLTRHTTMHLTTCISPRAPGKALQFFELAGEMGHADAAFEAGRRHMIGGEGAGTERSVPLALGWFERAAENDHVEVSYSSGWGEHTATTSVDFLSLHVAPFVSPARV